MKTYRLTAVIVGVLWIIGTVGGVLSRIPYRHITSSDYLTAVSANANEVVIGMLFILIMGFALAMVPVVLFPLLRRYNEALAIGAVVFRGALEAVTYIVAVIIWGVILTLSREYVATGASNTANFQTLGTLIKGVDFWNSQMISIVFCIGTSMVYYLFYISKLIPRWLSVSGLIAVIPYFAAALLAMFDTELEILMLPLAVQEMVFALWLIVRGFNQSAIVSEPV